MAAHTVHCTEHEEKTSAGTETPDVGLDLAHVLFKHSPPNAGIGKGVDACHK